MFIRGKGAVRAVAVVLVITLFHVYVLADATRPNLNTGTSPAPAGVIFGKLSLPGNQVMIVNGNSVGTGTTIFSGSQLQTPADTEAAVQLGAAGYLDIAPDSMLTVAFDKASVDVRVTKGSAVLSTNAGVKGTVTNADGSVENSDPASASSIIGGATTGKATRAAAKLSKEEKAALIIIPSIIAVIIIILIVNDDDNDDNVSPGSPNRLT
jgi:hypothetical protein